MTKIIDRKDEFKLRQDESAAKRELRKAGMTQEMIDKVERSLSEQFRLKD